MLLIFAKIKDWQSILSYHADLTSSTNTYECDSVDSVDPNAPIAGYTSFDVHSN